MVSKTMSKIRGQLQMSSTISDGIMFLYGMLATLIIVYFFPSITLPSISFPSPTPPSLATIPDTLNFTTFYDDPHYGSLMDSPIKNWDEKRHQWLTAHPSLSRSAERVLMVTGSQPAPCTNPDGDHLLLRLFKNKVDYCRIHGHDIFYNNVLLHPWMYGFWAKYPLVKAAMLSHPEVEWIWWVDSDAVFTDMDFDLPLEKYKAYNLIVYGWPDALYKQNSSMGLNAGVFLIRNCQWSMDLLDRWASFGPQTENFAKWGRIQKSIFADKVAPISDDQSALCYMIIIERDRWADKFYLETEYEFQGYFMAIINKFENVTRHYAEIEGRVPELRRRHAEKFEEEYRALWKEYLDGLSTSRISRRPFVTHFTGCEPCSGERNPIYSDEQCRGGMVKALNFGDSQVLRNFGYTRHDISNSSSVEAL
ncbi:galactomannan galactosyltransferase 1-like [Silene latifolia]|uniref:galactomannan galactosyltransferase 1-like n=1 Tax=Silene latifolia TaxID=37657 RepID=UPI003D780B92